MSRANTIQTNFTSGEVSPMMYGRIDIAKYFNGARQLKNMIVRPQGGAFRRPGTRYVATTKTVAKKSRLIPFVFSTTQSYMLEFGDLYFRIYKDGGVVETFVGSGVPAEFATPWLEADLAAITFTQSADVLYIAHPSYQTRKISRTSHTAWTVSLYAPTDGPYMSVDKTGTKLQATESAYSDTQPLFSSYTGTGITITATGGTPFAGAAGDVGKYVEYKDQSGRYTLALITAFISTTQATVTIVDPSTMLWIGGVITFAAGNLTAASGGFNANSAGKKLRLSASQAWYTVGAYGGSPTIIPGAAITIITYGGGVTMSLAQSFLAGGVTDVGKYIEWRDEVGWKLGQIVIDLDIANTSIKRLDERVRTVTTDTRITFAAGQISSNKAATFSNGDVGKYIRLTASQAWYKMTTFASDTVMNATVVAPLFTYTYPFVSMTLWSVRNVVFYLYASRDKFVSTDVGRAVRLRFGATWVPVTVFSYISPTQILVTTDVGLPRDPLNGDAPYNNGYCDEYRMGAWSDTTGWPAKIGFHEQRLVFAKTATEPQNVWGSRSGDYEAMAPTERDGTVAADNGFTYTIASDQANPVSWIRTGPVLLIGTTGSEFQMKATTLNEPITPNNVDMKGQTAFGSPTDGYAHRIGSTLVFLQKGNCKVREMTYDYTIDAFVSKDLTIMSEHILKKGGGAYQSDFQKEVTMIVWYVLTDGTLAAMTFEKDQEVVAWHRHVIGGVGVVVESVACIPSMTSGAADDVYLIVRRTVNASTTRYVERIERFFDTSGGDAAADMFYVDCGLSYSGAPATVFGGLSHLNTETVQVVADGTYLGTRVVAGNSITLTKAASKVHIGYGSQALIETLDPEGGSQAGSSQGKTKRINSLDVRVKDTMPFKVGESLTKLLKLSQSDFTTLKTGDVRVSPETAYDSGARLMIEQSDPVALNVLAIMPALNTNE